MCYRTKLPGLALDEAFEVSLLIRKKEEEGGWMDGRMDGESYKREYLPCGEADRKLGC